VDLVLYFFDILLMLGFLLCFASFNADVICVSVHCSRWFVVGFIFGFIVGIGSGLPSCSSKFFSSLANKWCINTAVIIVYFKNYAIVRV